MSKILIACVVLAATSLLGCGDSGGDVGYGGEVKTAPAGAGTGKPTPGGTTAGKPPPSTPE